MEAQSFFAGVPTHVCILNLNHKFTSALDQPAADEISHIMIFDLHYRPLSLLNINCDTCILAQEDPEVRRLFAELLDSGDTPFRGPPPKYEVDRTLPDYHQQDQEQTDTDQQRQRTPEARERNQPWSTRQRSVFREIFDETPSQQPPDETLIDLAESESDDEALIDPVQGATSDEDLIELSRMDETASTVMARDFAYTSMDETTTVAILNRIFPALIPERMDERPECDHSGETRNLR